MLFIYDEGDLAELIDCGPLLHVLAAIVTLPIAMAIALLMPLFYGGILTSLFGAAYAAPLLEFVKNITGM